ncbi:MAG: imidazoleglycerol-phosphate dehydratase HisB [Pleomorphochaeta sp.]
MKQNKGPILFIECTSLVIPNTKNDNYIEFQPLVFRGLSQIVDKGNFNLVLLSSCKECETISKNKKIKLCEYIQNEFAKEKIFFEKEIVDYDLDTLCPKFTYDNLNQLGFLNGDYDLQNSFIIGSVRENINLSNKLEIKNILYSKEKEEQNNTLALVSDDWATISKFLVDSDLKPSRKVHVVRNTKETMIDLEINLDGTGKSNIDTKIKFFDHMLEQISRHSDIDINLVCDGDVEVDEHHSVEDVAIALGSAISKAIGDKKGLSRYGYNLLAMDEVLAKCSIDFSNRPYCVYDVPITREYIGSFPTEMFEHFFKSFSDSSKSTLHINVSSGNSHHMIEAVYKCFAKCLKQALYVYPFSDKLPTTKGVI